MATTRFFAVIAAETFLICMIVSIESVEAFSSPTSRLTIADGCRHNSSCGCSSDKWTKYDRHFRASARIEKSFSPTSRCALSAISRTTIFPLRQRLQPAFHSSKSTCLHAENNDIDSESNNNIDSNDKIAVFLDPSTAESSSPLNENFPHKSSNSTLPTEYNSLSSLPEPSPNAIEPADATKPTSNDNAPFVGLPSYQRISFFVATTVLIWVSEPLLSLVDSAMVGRYAGLSSASTSASSSTPNLSSVIQLAALGPATMLCDSSIYLTFFIAMATTNKLARAFAKNDKEEQIKTVSHVLGVSLLVGALLSLMIYFGGENLLRYILGPSGATVSIEGRSLLTRLGGASSAKVVDLTPQVLRASLGYSRIRSAVYPLAVMGLTSQAALLCAQDTRTPALAVLVASLVNVIGDYLFVAKFGWGVRGAALATSMASSMANGLLVGKLWKMTRIWRESLAKEKKQMSDPIRLKLEVASNERFNSNEPLKTPFVSLPDRQSFVSLLKLAGPLFLVLIGKVMGYSAMTVKSGNFGMVALACHNILLRVFFFFGTVGDGLGHAAQTFLPGLLYSKSLQERSQAKDDATMAYERVDNKDDDQDARTLLKRLLSISTIFSVINCFAGRFIANSAGATFTNDESLLSLMSHVSPFVGLALLMYPWTMTLEGSIIAGRDSSYLVGTYAVSVMVLFGHLKYACKEFVGVWHALVLFQLIRIVQFGSRVWKRTASSKQQRA